MLRLWGSEEHFAHKHCGLCRSLEHRTRDCEERGAEKGAILRCYVCGGVKSILRINIVVCAEAWSTILAIVRSEELRRVRYWPKWLCQ